MKLNGNTSFYGGILLLLVGGIEIFTTYLKSEVVGWMVIVIGLILILSSPKSRKQKVTVIGLFMATLIILVFITLPKK
ncbi:hypothetical protein [Sinomicrobium sp. M5D2P9]